jgi:transposase
MKQPRIPIIVVRGLPVGVAVLRTKVRRLRALNLVEKRARIFRSFFVKEQQRAAASQIPEYQKNAIPLFQSMASPKSFFE